MTQAVALIAVVALGTATQCICLRGEDHLSFSDAIEREKNSFAAREIELFHREDTNQKTIANFKTVSITTNVKRHLSISHFEDNGNRVTRWTVDMLGRLHESSGCAWSSLTHQRCQLSPAKLDAVNRWLSLLEAPTESPPIHRAVVLSFRKGQVWTTEVYDSDRLPDALRSLIADLSIIHSSN
jgi:hypothetical protein